MKTAQRHALMSVPLWLISLFAVACLDEGVPPPPPTHVSTVQLSAQDVAVTEVWVRLKFTDQAQPRSYALRRDNLLIATGALAGADTLLADTIASPAHTYRYTGLRLTGTVPTDSSPALQVTTLDTTSHQFSSVRIDTLGNISPSALYDVAILSDSNIWAVGEIYRHGPTFDTLYNSARWDGTRWTTLQIPFMYQGQPFIGQLYSVFGNNANDVWFGAGNMIHWDGQTYVSVELPPDVWGPNRMRKIWGSPDGQLYVVGDNGAMARRSSSGTWTRLQSGTTVSINDIWGVVDQASGSRTILCAAANIADPGPKQILRITEQNTVDTIGWLPKVVHSLWFPGTSRVFACGDGVYVRNPNMQWREFISAGTIPYFTEVVRGVAPNDIFVVGDFGTIAHSNGVTAERYSGLAAALVYSSAAYNGNLMVAVGYTSSRAIVVQMRR